MEGFSVKDAPYQKIEDAPEMGKPEDCNNSALHKSSDEKESGMCSKPIGYRLLPPSTLAFIAIVLAGSTVSAACSLPGDVTTQSKWEYRVFCMSNTFCFFSKLSVLPILLFGKLNAKFLVASAKASSRMLQLAIISTMMAFCSGRLLVVEGTRVVNVIHAIGIIGVIGSSLITFFSYFWNMTYKGEE